LYTCSQQKLAREEAAADAARAEAGACAEAAAHAEAALRAEAAAARAEAATARKEAAAAKAAQQRAEAVQQAEEVEEEEFGDEDYNNYDQPGGDDYDNYEQMDSDDAVEADADRLQHYDMCALPAAMLTLKMHLDVVPNPQCATAKDAELMQTAYRRFVVRSHPDKGGDAAVFQLFQAAYDTWKRCLAANRV
jgi:hypothetical protein